MITLDNTMAFFDDLLLKKDLDKLSYDRFRNKAIAAIALGCISSMMICAPGSAVVFVATAVCTGSFMLCICSFLLRLCCMSKRAN